MKRQIAGEKEMGDSHTVDRSGNQVKVPHRNEKLKPSHNLIAVKEGQPGESPTLGATISPECEVVHVPFELTILASLL